MSPDYGPTGNEFSGEVNWVQIDLEKDDHDHLISPEERFRSRWRGSRYAALTARATQQLQIRVRDRSMTVRNSDDSDRKRIEQLPIPDIQHSGLITYDAKDPDTKFPPIRDSAAAEGRAQRAGDPHRRRRLRRHQRVRRPVPDAELREAREGRAAVHALPHHGAVLADAAGAAHRPQPSLGRHGRHHRDRDRRSRLSARCCPTPRRRWR